MAKSGGKIEPNKENIAVRWGKLQADLIQDGKFEIESAAVTRDFSGETGKLERRGKMPGES